MHIYAHQWVMDVSAAGYPPFVLIMSGMAGLFVWMSSVVVARWPGLPLLVAAPVVWTALEVFRGEILASGYPWILIAHPLIDAPLIPSTATLLGTYFTGFLVVVVAAAAVEAVVAPGKSRRLALASVGVVAISGVAHLARPGPSGRIDVRIAIVQTNIPQSNKLEWSFESRMKDFARFCELTRAAASGPIRPHVIVWPETMFPGITLSAQGIAEERAAKLTFDVPEAVDSRGAIPSTEFYDRLVAMSGEIRIPMIVGALGFKGLEIKSHPDGGVMFDHRSRFNSVFLVQQATVDPVSYDKLDLTPFGEVMPGIRHWPWLQSQLLAIGAGGMAFDLSPGAGPHAFVLADPAVSIVTPICFEATKPRLCRRLVRAAGGGPVIMTNLTNDGWFGTFRTGRMQHLQIARWRCLELGVPMVRAANTGISAAIDISGRVVSTGVDGKPGAWNEDGVLNVVVGATPARTLYARVGEVFGWIALTIGAGMVAWALGSVKKHRSTEVAA